MVKNDAPVVVDAGPVIHLDELDCLDLLSDFSPLLMPRSVWNEVAAHRPRLAIGRLPPAQIIDVIEPPSPRLVSLKEALHLHAGELAALTLAQTRSARLFLCDDAAARVAGESMGFAVHGSIGVLVRSVRRGMRSREQVLATLRELPHRSTLHLSHALLATVIAQMEGSGGAA